MVDLTGVMSTMMPIISLVLVMFVMISLIKELRGIF